MDLRRDRVRRRSGGSHSGGRNRVPVWSPDGEHVAFQSNREGDLAIFWQRTDGTAQAERLARPDKDTAHVPESWSPDGKTLLFSVAKCRDTVTALSIPIRRMATLVEAADSAQSALRGVFAGWAMARVHGCDEGAAIGPSECPAVSADRRALSGLASTLVAMRCGRPMGRNLLSNPAAATQKVAVSVTTRPSFTFGKPVPLLSGNPEPVGLARNNDITLDGKLLVVLSRQNPERPDKAVTAQINVTLELVRGTEAARADEIAWSLAQLVRGTEGARANEVADDTCHWRPTRPVRNPLRLGAGGMGEVYPGAGHEPQARGCAQDPARVIRARSPIASRGSSAKRKMLASLNHPNIAGIYGLEDSGGDRRS